MFPVVFPPKVRFWFAVVCSVPSAVRYEPPLKPAERVAVGVPEFTLITANFEEEVAVPPNAKSRVELTGYNKPLVEVKYPWDKGDTQESEPEPSVRNIYPAV